MEKFSRLVSVAIPLIRDNVDTDAIIPSREMKSVGKTGLADGLFAGWRYLGPSGRVLNPDFVLNDPYYSGARILLGGANFGCGSSREHAAWALHEYGFRAIVAPSFNPIFRENCVRNGILPVAMDPRPLTHAGGAITVDLESESISTELGQTWPFTIDQESRRMLLEGLDAISLTLERRDEISAFRRSDREARPWAYLAR
jgi:3-isopropylmalate/(R)-2-methylmalate dehydratase small subunit